MSGFEFIYRQHLSVHQTLLLRKVLLHLIVFVKQAKLVTSVNKENQFAIPLIESLQRLAFANIQIQFLLQISLTLKTIL